MKSYKTFLLESEGPLLGLPQKPIDLGNGKTHVPGPNQKIRNIASDYMKSAGLPYNPPKDYKPVDPDRATRIAGEFGKMKHDPSHPDVKASYDAMKNETLAQYQHMKKSGLKIDWIKDGQEDPYKKTPHMGAADVRDNNHLWAYKTEHGFGSGGTSDSDHPLLQDSGEESGGHKMLHNDVFRVVHDYFGHFKEGNGFRAGGEENAWRQHSAMYSPLARGAMTSETRGQNSYVNYGPNGEHNRKASAGDTIYADQKVGLMPDWTHKEGA